MDAVNPVNASAVMADPTGDECPGCAATVQAWTCTAVQLSVLGLLPTPQLRTAAFLTVLRTEVARRSCSPLEPGPGNPRRDARIANRSGQ
ncbi:MAG: hypothetical protein ACRDSZ_01535 [Pseudonocardiaceae bacterium]